MKPTIAFIILYFPLMITMHAVNPNNTFYSSKKEGIEKPFTIKDFVNSNNKQWSSKTGKKLKWTEKITLNILRKKLKKKAKSNPAILDTPFQIEEEAFNINDIALLAGLTSIGAIFLAMMGMIGFVYLSLIAAPIAVFTGIIGLESKKPGKSKAIWGIVLGLLISGLWIWAYNFF